jgi:hypothetical protein
MGVLSLQLINDPEGWCIDRPACFKQGRDGFPAGKPFVFGE